MFKEYKYYSLSEIELKKDGPKEFACKINYCELQKYSYLVAKCSSSVMGHELLCGIQ